ncbi:MAG: tyrosine-type recombinase/integrase [Eggerthellaceae bacterium]|nr:tyrosine-type recombinase/integrase [Eggerthellaceae bacterium]
MSAYVSGFAGLVDRFVSYRKAAGVWNEGCYGLNIKLFDRWCAEAHGPGAALSQEMVDGWCARRATETNRSCGTRAYVVKAFVEYLRARGLTDVDPPRIPKPEPRTYVPYAFGEGELARFFEACDSIVAYKGARPHVIRKLTLPVFFRLLYSTGLRTTEARLLGRDDVDLAHGVISVRESKGHDQHFVAMHESMAGLMSRYDSAIDGLQPSRRYFFQSPLTGSCYDQSWVGRNFRVLWRRANGCEGPRPVPYELRHNYATANINSWAGRGLDALDGLAYLSKSMGHRHVESTLGYYSVVPGLAGTLREKSSAAFDEIVPEVG